MLEEKLSKSSVFQGSERNEEIFDIANGGVHNFLFGSFS